MADPRQHTLRCWWCAHEFASPTQQRRMCSDRCRRNAATASSERRASPIYVRDCALCDRVFVARDSKGRFCGTGCRTARKTSRIYHIDCATCGSPVIRRRPWSRFCSTSCSTHSRGSRESRGLVTGRARLAILKRDDWTCHLCGLQIATREFRNRPGDPTVDHLLPRSKGGTNDPSNLAAAHFVCNARRGNRPLAA